MEAKILESVRIFTNPKRYLDFRARNANNIVGSKIIAPKLGSRDFGAIEVRIKNTKVSYSSNYNQGKYKVKLK